MTMEKSQKNIESKKKSVLSKLNDNPDQKKKVDNSDKDKGIIGEINDETEIKKK